MVDPIAAIEVGPEEASDLESSYGDEIQSYTTSLSSSITNYQYENGRRYHAFRAGTYPMPNDETESDRLELIHHLMTLLQSGKLHLAPIGDNPGRVLDIGTGTGRWAIEMGDMYPSADVLGIDLSPIQPLTVPSNVRFQIDDVESPWVYSNPFDYIHCRYMAGAIGNWPALAKQTFHSLKPGGWVEFQDWDHNIYADDGTLSDEHTLRKWNVELLKAFSGMGREGCPGPKLQTWVQDAGFKNITHEIFKAPVGPWPKDKRYKEIGMANLCNLLEGLEAVTLAPFTRALGWTADEVQVLLAGVKKDVKNPRIHSQINYHIVYAQKPLSE